MKRFALALVLAWPCLPALGQSDPTVTVDFSNPGLTPPKWTLVLHADGRAHFHSDAGEIAPRQIQTITPAAIDRDVALNAEFTHHVFDVVHRHNFMKEECESHLKVAFQGLKRIAYSGPDGTGACEFNYSKNREVQTLGESLVAVSATIVEGVRLELLRQHDPLGLDQEMEFLKEASEDGRLQQVCTIQGILTKLEADPGVMERVRRSARLLLAEYGAK
jgi:hypothetical protein